LGLTLQRRFSSQQGPAFFWISDFERRYPEKLHLSRRQIHFSKTGKNNGFCEIQTNGRLAFGRQKLRIAAIVLLGLAALATVPSLGHAQAALLMAEPYGFFGSVNPTGHNAIYFERICAETPTRLRRCRAGELGTVISRYQGINGYDWVAIPLVPYLYAVENTSQIPAHVDRQTVRELRSRYHESHLLGLGSNLHPGNFVRGGWTELIGLSYERRIFAFRFETTEAQDDAFIARMNGDKNHSQFNLLFNNCSDFARQTLNFYFPHTFRRSAFPDAGMTTPKQIAFKLVRYSRKHPEIQLTVFEIPQTPGYRRLSRSNKNIAESLVTTVYAVPIAVMNPYLAGGIFVDYFVRGRSHLIPKHPQMLTPDKLVALTAQIHPAQNSLDADVRALGAAANRPPETPGKTVNSDLAEIRVEHEQVY